ncbi:MAG: glycosyltransferase [Victivallales bacterium]|jgi:glycosyltransferase involved in cell wall biosynthesis|nr:glycosyltransferase [Victivallales bacterium]
MPLLTIIVPVYNPGKRLRICLDSLLSQEVQDFELILIDDGSTDDSAGICREYCAKHPDKIRFFSGENRGVSFARNRGLDVAQGEWVAFCDSDDTVEPKIYRYMYDRAIATNADLSCCALKMISENGSEKSVNEFPCVGEQVIAPQDKVRKEIWEKLLLSQADYHGYSPICLFRRDLIEKAHIRFTEKLNILEDMLFMLEYLLQVNIIAISDKPLYNYLRFDSSLCSRYFSSQYAVKLEKSWMLLEKRRLEIFLGSGESKNYPGLAFKFRLRVYYHWGLIFLRTLCAKLNPKGGNA